jgi:hypothetical protein
VYDIEKFISIVSFVQYEEVYPKDFSVPFSIGCINDSSSITFTYYTGGIIHEYKNIDHLIEFIAQLL